jgi:periplasmic divalent cation tolerance protein
MEACVVLVTVPNETEGLRIARHVVQERLVACVNIVQTVRSVFRWEDEICDEGEALLLMKTRREAFRELEECVRSLHPYDVPEIIALPIVQGSSEYLSWVFEETGGA